MFVPATRFYCYGRSKVRPLEKTVINIGRGLMVTLRFYTITSGCCKQKEVYFLFIKVSGPQNHSCL